ncbi:carotenoid oxygenase [Candidatus Roizmanbacteria bacterium CG_4_8_14_3_um_filter_34_9]|uniref:Carotenoid oxygenase n=3 Tax=Candidatus Roizmaniibacteriota TaxID=1752723 RepID=A0A2M7AUC9_9BACT|nr:MAG: carotenoid oxygenase [Candidatus Roizmanbacteria bacterium CG07_land_8_20_14_0_80_34_15]PIU74241.1 MAG: carotenoid oxygenase [Candidatus Roizmanbacteria bacterium CG06_land_8_20_14_3_00_34_14]PIW73184.1 MAG: carotenoid oxygenase [Candidatus Roizmanbacteria bacterium CG_4_8_14_3_um_filter_34_9]
MISTIIFDFDGTIADTLPFSFKKFLEIAHLLKIDDLTDKEIIKEIRSKSYQELLKGSFKRAWLKIPFVINIVKSMQVELEKEMSNIKFFPGIKKILFDLKKNGYKLAIISSNRIENIDKFIKHNDLDIFDFVHGKTDLFGKAGYLGKFLDDFDLDSSEVIYVGDEIRDVEACKKVGIKIIGVTWGLHTPEALQKAGVDYIVKKPSEVFKIITP